MGGGECSVHLNQILECVRLNQHLLGGQMTEPAYASSAPLNEGRRLLVDGDTEWLAWPWQLFCGKISNMKLKMYFNSCT